MSANTQFTNTNACPLCNGIAGEYEREFRRENETETFVAAVCDHCAHTTNGAGVFVLVSNNLTPEELLTIANVLTFQAFNLLEQHPGDVAFQERAQALLKLANKANAQWHRLAA